MQFDGWKSQRERHQRSDRRLKDAFLDTAHFSLVAFSPVSVEELYA
jgi:hypothetical protein